MKLLLKELFAVFLGTQSDPIKGIQKKISFYTELMKPQEVQNNLFCTEKGSKPQHNSLAELQSA